jgi:uncharacterized protein YdeI (YjbR/CyaY-like superfamily)
MMIEDIEEYFAKGCGRCARFGTLDCSTRRWARGLRTLRQVCLGAGLEERVKWAHPCYGHAGRNVAIVGAFRGDFRLSFFDAALMTDPERVLERQGPNTRHPDMIRFASNDQVAAMETTIRAYLEEAMGYAARGLRPLKDDREPDLPDELAEALDADPALAEAFHALTSGRRRSHVVSLRSAARAETRVRRIAALRPKILAGKGATER